MWILLSSSFPGVQCFALANHNERRRRKSRGSAIEELIRQHLIGAAWCSASSRCGWKALPGWRDARSVDGRSEKMDSLTRHNHTDLVYSQNCCRWNSKNVTFMSCFLIFLRNPRTGYTAPNNLDVDFTRNLLWLMMVWRHIMDVSVKKLVVPQCRAYLNISWWEWLSTWGCSRLLMNLIMVNPFINLD